MSSWKCRVSCRIRTPSSSSGGLAAHLEAHRPLHRAQRVHVLGLGPGAPLEAADRRQRGVHVAAQVALLHAHLGDAEREQDLAQLGDVGLGHLGRLRARARDRPGDDLDQRDAGAVVVDQRVRGPVDATGGATDVQVLAGVLLQVHPLDLHAVGLAVDLDVQVPGGAQRLVVLRGLEALGDVRVEVVLPGEPAPRRDPAAQGQPDPDRRLDRGRVGHRQRAGQAQADRAGLGVGLLAEGGGAAAEHLRRRAELDVRLQPDHRLVAGEDLVEVHQSIGAHGVSSLDAVRPVSTAPRPVSRPRTTKTAKTGGR